MRIGEESMALIAIASASGHCKALSVRCADIEDMCLLVKPDEQLKILGRDGASA